MERQFRFFCCCASSLMEHIFAASFVFRFYWFLRGSFFFGVFSRAKRIMLDLVDLR